MQFVKWFSFSSTSKRELLIVLLLIFLTSAVYWQVREFSYINYDDPCYVYNNSIVLSGLSVESIKWAFTTTGAGNWHPLTWVSYLLDIELFGSNPGKLHLVNLSLHVTSTVLLFLAFVYMTGFLARSAFVAALFALHPLHVESVAWISERKDVLSTLFWILVIVCYSWYTKKPFYSQEAAPPRYIFVLILFLLGLMSKSMLVTGPFILLLLDFWPLRRLQEEHYVKGQRLPTRSLILLLVWEKVPFFILSLVVGLGTLLAQMKSNALASVEALPLTVRVSNALISYVMYLIKMVWPVNLSVIYPHSGELKLWEPIFSLLLLVAISFLAIKAYRKAPFLIVGWLWYLGSLLPVIGIVQVGEQAFADRYTYIPLIGVFIMVVWALGEIARILNRRRSVAVLGIVIVAFFMILTYWQVTHWKNTISLFTRAIKIDSKNPTGHNNLGWAYESEALNFDSAIFHYSQALELRPSVDLFHRNIGRAFAKKEQYERALYHLTEALRLRPKSAEAHDQLGQLLMKTDRIPEAVIHFSEAVEIEPHFADAHSNLGTALKADGNLDLAIFHFRKALLIKPDFESARANLEEALKAKRQW